MSSLKERQTYNNIINKGINLRKINKIKYNCKYFKSNITKLLCYNKNKNIFFYYCLNKKLNIIKQNLKKIIDTSIILDYNYKPFNDEIDKINHDNNNKLKELNNIILNYCFVDEINVFDEKKITQKLAILSYHMGDLFFIDDNSEDYTTKFNFSDEDYKSLPTLKKN